MASPFPTAGVQAGLCTAGALTPPTEREGGVPLYHPSNTYKGIRKKGQGQPIISEEIVRQGVVYP